MKKLSREEVIEAIAKKDADKMINGDLVTYDFFYELAVKGFKGLDKYSNKELIEEYYDTFQEEIVIFPMLSLEERIERLKSLYSLSNVAEILGYYNETNPDLDYEKLDFLQKNNHDEYVEEIYRLGAENGIFEDSINLNTPFYLN